MTVRPSFGLMLSALALSACPGEEPGPGPVLPGDDDDAVGDDDDASPACDPPLALDPDGAAALPLDLLFFHGLGGTGDYRFELSEAPSGGRVNDRSGAYLAGETLGVTDVVRLTDLGCEGEALAEVRVVPELLVRPREGVIPPDTRFAIEVEGGSGSHACADDGLESGGSLDGCTYTAGSTEGVDRLVVTDLETGDSRAVRLVVSADAALLPDPPRVGVPLGSDHALRIRGGTGWFELEPASSPVVGFDGTALTALSPGRVEFTVTDRFAGLTAELVVDVLEPLDVPLVRAGDGHLTGVARAAGDLDGDGFPDLVMSHPEADLGAFNGGAVLVYRGTADGLDPVPAQIIAGASWVEALGQDFALADVDGDGETDLLVGVPGRDAGFGDAGVVELYAGLPGGFFDPQPALTLAGERAADNFGRSVAACDFNGDGRMDLAVGAWQAEDRDQQVVAFGQGAVLVFLGREAGLPVAPDRRLYGKVPDGAGGWVGDGSMRLGSTLAAGDVTGDGLCDLVAATPSYDGEQGTNLGALFVYPGLAPEGGSLGGLFTDPAVGWTTLQPGQDGSTLGDTLAVGDVTGDQAAEILVSHRLWDVGDGGQRRQGAARLFLGGTDWASAPATEWLDAAGTADWSALGDDAFDYAGWGTALADVNGDGLPDVLLGNLRDELDGSPTNAGTVDVHFALPGGLPAAAPDLEVAGETPDGYFGLRVAALPDVDGDGLGELFVHAGRDPLHGIRVGTPFVVATSGARTALELPGLPSGQEIGRGIEVTPDLDGDGLADLLAGAPGADRADADDAGAVFLHPGSAGSFAVEPAAEWGAFAGNTADDRLGWDATWAGDFNGDGYGDAALLARYDDRPGSFGTTWANRFECPGSRSDVGSVSVFLGGPEGLGADPAFVYFGPDASDTLQVVDGGFDYDGDGYDDLLVGSSTWDAPGLANAGGAALIGGRPEDPSGITVICAEDWTFRAAEAEANAGSSVTGVGDLDGDGCDEFAVGAGREDLGLSNQGSVRLFFGWGGPGCRSVPEYLTFVPLDAGAQLGWSLDAGPDVDGDGLPDLATGGPTLTVDGNQVGGAWLLTAAHALSHTPEAWFDGQAPTVVAPVTAGPGFQLHGEEQGEQFGRSVALVPGVEPDGRAALAVGSALGGRAGPRFSGGARVHRFSTEPEARGLSAVPWAVLGGETGAPDSRLGEHLSAGEVGGVPILVIGGYRADGLVVDAGAVYALPLR